MEVPEMLDDSVLILNRSTLTTSLHSHKQRPLFLSGAVWCVSSEDEEEEGERGDVANPARVLRSQTELLTQRDAQCKSNYRAPPINTFLR